MKIVFTLISSFFVGIILSQTSTVDSAQFFFDRYEYALSAELIEKENPEIVPEKLDENRLKKLIYSYYRMGNYEKLVPLGEWLVNSKLNEPYFYLILGDAYSALNNAEQAVKNYENFQKEDGTIDVSIKIQSVKTKQNWQEEELEYLISLPYNQQKATQNTNIGEDNSIVLNEVAFNGKGVRTSNLERAEYFIMRPFSVHDGALKEIEVAGLDDFSSIKSLSKDPESNIYYASVFNPIDEKKKEFNVLALRFDKANNSFELNPDQELLLPLSDSIIMNELSFSPDGSFLVFSGYDISSKNTNLYRSNRKNDGWEEPKNMDEINTPGNEISPLFLSDSTLSFASDGRLGYGDFDIYIAELNNEKVVNINHPKHPINSSKDDFKYYLINDSTFMFSSNRFLSEFADDNIFTGQYEQEKVIEIDIVEIPDFMDIWTTQNIYFEFDQAVVLDKFDQVDEFVEYVTQNPNVTVVLTGYTDTRGSRQYNRQLGRKRADEAKVALSKRGISPSQILTYSKGDTEPFVDCSKGCTEDQHAKNRVVTIDLIKF